MRFDSGTTDVPTAGTRVQILDSEDRVLAIEFHARAGNAGNVYAGVLDVSATNGRELVPGEAVPYDFTLSTAEGSVPFSTFYVDAATSGDDVDWAVKIA